MPARDMILPPVHNTRSPEQWRIISQHVDFDGKTVLDLGCGHGDLLWRAWKNGALDILGVENDRHISTLLNEAADQIEASFIAYDIDIENLTAVATRESWFFDVVICFSVLPYLADPLNILNWIFFHSRKALIECQLAGDGPGFDWLKSPQDMRRWLDSIGWKSVQRIGETVVKDRGAKRGIWLCQQ